MDKSTESKKRCTISVIGCRTVGSIHQLEVLIDPRKGDHGIIPLEVRIDNISMYIPRSCAEPVIGSTSDKSKISRHAFSAIEKRAIGPCIGAATYEIIRTQVFAHFYQRIVEFKRCAVDSGEGNRLHSISRLIDNENRVSEVEDDSLGNIIVFDSIVEGSDNEILLSLGDSRQHKEGHDNEQLSHTAYFFRNLTEVLPLLRK